MGNKILLYILSLISIPFPDTVCITSWNILDNLYYCLIYMYIFPIESNLIIKLISSIGVVNFRVFEIYRLIVGNWHKSHYLTSLPRCFFFLISVSHKALLCDHPVNKELTQDKNCAFLYSIHLFEIFVYLRLLCVNSDVCAMSRVWKPEDKDAASFLFFHIYLGPGGGSCTRQVCAAKAFTP